MKKLIGIIIILIAFTAKTQAADNVYTSIGMPGDNLNLSLVLDIFKQSNSIQEFESKLNAQDTRVNNLDLNNDGTIDYLKVTDYGKDNYHTIIIQDIVSAYETQDVAIIDIEKNNGNLVHIQIIGDESLYGKNYIIEPQLETAKNYQSTNQPTTVVNNNYYVNQNPVQYVNAWSWPCVNVIFSNNYSPWVSPWHWASYPTWWNPRPRVVYNVYYGYHNGFGWNNYCHRNYVINKGYYHDYYKNRRVTSNTVQVNNSKNIYNNNTGNNSPRGHSYNNTNQNNPGKNGNNSGKWNNSPTKNNNGKPNATNNQQNVNNQNQPKNNNPKWNNNNNNSGSQNGQWSNPNKPTKSTTTPSGNKGNNGNNNGGFKNNSNGNGGVKIGSKAK